MKLTTRGRYALQAIIDLITNSNGKAVKLMDISVRQNLPIAYLEQLFRQLRIGGVVNSVRGPGGGYVLAKEPSEISMHDVFKSVEEVVSYDLGDPGEEAPDALRKAHAAILQIDEATQRALSTKLSSLV